MDISKLVSDIIEDTDNSLINDVKKYDRNAMNELIAHIRVECFAEYDSDEIQSEIKNQLDLKSDKKLSNNSDTEYFRGCPTVNKKEERLAFQNPNNDIIHICRTNPSKGKSKSYGWSECGFGSSKGKSKKTAIYVDSEDVNNGYVIRNGEIIGKICGNCSTSY